MFETVLVANRGEIAVRVIRTLRSLGLRSVAVHSDADADARHVREADTAVRIGPAPAAESYLSAQRLLEAAVRTGAQAVHPGYGFLAENADFARACGEAGLVFIGPSAEAISLMGDKIRAKETVRAAGVPVVPGSSGSGLTDAQLADAAREIGMPVLLKPSAGGGGKGMRLVRDAERLADEIAAARREARASFGDDTLLVERRIDRPRHIEIQVLADAHGNVVHLGERECSLQRRHQKIIEEAPSVLLDEGTRAAMGEAAVRAARSCGYRGAGTVEFIVPGGTVPVGGKPPEPPVSSYYFMEMNTRLQVEHPVTELVTGLDLVEWQLRVAAGERLPYAQDDITLTGHAIEARICAEDPARGFLPSGGTVLALHEPQGNGVRTDSGLSEGTEVGSLYDPMLSKVIAYGPDRATALRRLRAALAETVTLGVQTNAGFLRRLLAHPDVTAGDLDTGLVEREVEGLVPGEVPDEVYAVAALLRRAALGPGAAGWVDPFSVPDGWRLGGERAWTAHHLQVPGHEPVTVRVRGTADGAVELLLGGEHGEHGERPLLRRAGVLHPAAGGGSPSRFTCGLDGVTHTFAALPAGTWIGRDGDAWHVRDHDPVAASLTGAARSGADSLTAPMPGTVTVVKVTVGDEVAAGQSLLVVEAMKMEHIVSAPHAGTVSELDVTPGTTVAMDQVLAVIAPGESSPEEENDMSIPEPGLPMAVPAPDLPARVRIYEVGARDGLQNEKGTVPTAVKAEFIRRLAGAGLTTIEATSFIHPKWVPQLADAEQLFPLVGDLPVALPVLVPNERGLDRALALGATRVAVFASATESFAKANLNRTLDESLAMFEPVVARAKSQDVHVRSYVSMSFGDPWEGPVPVAQVVRVCRALLDMGCDELSLGDTIGVATPGHVLALLTALNADGIPTDALGVHFHDTYGQALANTLTALQHGVTTVDASAGGLGGCPYARSATGNLATEDLLWMLRGLGIDTGVDLARLTATSAWMAGQLGRPSPSRTVRALGRTTQPHKEQ